MKFESLGSEFEGEILGTSFTHEAGKAPTVVLFLKEVTTGDTIYANLYQFKKDADVWNADTQLGGYEQAKTALGWDGLSFDQFGAGAFDGTHVKFDTEENDYNGKISIRVGSVWNVNGDKPFFGLKPVDPNVIKAANSRLRFAKAQAPAAAAKKATVVKAKENPTTTVVAPAATTTAPATARAPSRRPATPVAKAENKEGPAPCSKSVAWLEVSDPDGNGNATQTTVETIWNETVNAVAGESTADEDITPEQWGTIRAKALAAFKK